MKFAHLADVHIGAWRDPKMADLPDRAFAEAISIAVAEHVDFILIAGDLFNTALPGIDHLKSAVKSLQSAKDADIPVYVIPGSHDFSPSGKSMLHVLEEAGILKDVFKGSVVNNTLRLDITVDPKTGCVLTGILGKKGMLDKQQYEALDKEDLQAKVKDVKNKIFLFHTSLEELRPEKLEKMEAYAVSMLPKGFDYYAGGHVHIVNKVSLEGYHEVVYPGPVFPASFSELEELRGGNMVIVENNTPRNVSLQLKKVVPLRVTIDDRTPTVATDIIISALEKEELDDAIVLLRVSGSLQEGTSSDIDFKRIFSLAYAKNAYFVMRNTVRLQSESATAQAHDRSAVVIEEDIIKEFVGRVAHPFGDGEVAVAKSLLHGLSAEKAEGETNTTYEERMIDEAKRILGLEQVK